MDNIFNSIALQKPSVSRFNMDHDHKTSFNMGELVPSCLMEALPGDRFEISVENMLRFAPLVSPVMHRINVTTHFYFVPNRLLWDGWEDFITGNEELEHPYFAGFGGGAVGTILNYLGYPPTTISTLKFNPMPFAAYFKIYDDYYRDQNLQTERFVPLVEGDNSSLYNPKANGEPLRRAWMHDYFTSALPFAQKGDSVQIPLTFQDGIPVEYTFKGAGAPSTGTFRKASDGTVISSAGTVTAAAGPVPLAYGMEVNSVDSAYDPNGTLTVDVQSDATTINDLRRAIALQKYLETNARAGTRYTEFLKAHFNVNSSDARLQRPEYIGGAYQRMTISEVLATATAVDPFSGEPTVPQGNMAGHGISVGGGQRFSHYCEEHGWIIGIINVQPVSAYNTQGVHRSLSRSDRFDYFTPSFEHIGEQAILNQEIYAASGTLQDMQGTFGYIPRYAEYKYMNSRASGEMTSNLIYWHLARTFSSLPELDETFISCSDDNTLNRIFAVTDPDVDHIYAHIFNNVSVVRKMSKYSIPGGL